MSTNVEAVPVAPVRERILLAADQLLTDGGPEALTNRAISALAGTQPPVIYRVFGDKQGLLEAVAAAQFARHLEEKSELTMTADPIADLRAGWDQHVAFGLAHPAVYVMVYGNVTEGERSPAALEAERMLAAYVDRVARAGQLRVPPALAVQMLHSAGRGVTLTLLGTPAGERDRDLSPAVREATIAAVAHGEPTESVRPQDSVGHYAIALQASLPEATGLTSGERGLLGEWLDRLSAVPAVESPELAG